MGYEYGIKQSREALLILSSEDSLSERAENALSEIYVVELEDVSPEHFNQIQKLRNKINSLADSSVTIDGLIVETDKKRIAKELIQELVWLCADIIEYNSQNTQK